MRCHDDSSYLWTFLLLLAWNDSQRSCAFPNEHALTESREWHSDDVQRAKKRSRQRPIAWSAGAVLVGLLIVALAWQPATPASATFATAAPEDALPVTGRAIRDVRDQAELPHVDAQVPDLTDISSSGFGEMLPLQSTPWDGSQPMTVVPDGASSIQSSAFFDVGSTREDVIAAQGGPPTYRTRDGRTMWWGSAKVIFSRDGRVESWTQGLPGLMVR